jgi:hypothetical protein
MTTLAAPPPPAIVVVSFNARVARGRGLGADSPVPTGAAAGDAPVLAHTLSLALPAAILNKSNIFKGKKQQS